MKTQKLNHGIYTGIIMLILFMMPVSVSDACLTHKVKDTNVQVQLPIAELQGLIQQLQDAGSQLVGEAGVQIRQSIAELSAEMEQRIDQIQNAGSELIAEASAEISSIINNLVGKAKELLSEVNRMIQQNIQCIDYVLAQRIQQITDAAYGIMDKIDSTLKNAIDRIYIRASMLVDTSTHRVALVVNNTLKIVVKIIIFIFCFLLLFWLIKMLWKSTFPKSKVLAIGIPVLIVLLVGAGTFLMLSKTALARMIGEEIPIPKWEESCDRGSSFYTSFISMKNEGKSIEELKPIGNTALEELNWCLYASVSPEATIDTYDKISTIKAILYPPVSAPPAPGTVITGSPCGSQGSIDPGWFSNRNFTKVEIWKKLSDKNVIRHSSVINPADYKARVNYINSAIILKPDINPIIDYKPPTDFNRSKINDKIIKQQGTWIR